MKLKKDYFDIC